MDTFKLWGATIGKVVSDGVDATGNLARQHLGPSEPITPFPESYDRLHNRAAVLGDAHKELVQVVSDFSKCRYKYPENLMKTVNQVTQTVLDGINNLSHATTFPPTSADSYSKADTFYHGLARAARQSAAILKGMSESESAESPDVLSTLAEVLDKYSECCSAIGDAQVAQDTEINEAVLVGWAESTSEIASALKRRKSVEMKRVDCDDIKRTISKHNIQVAKQGGSTVQDDDELQKLEAVNGDAEVSFIATVRDAKEEVRSAVTTMRSVQQVRALANAQLNFHNRAAAELELFMPVLDQLEKVQASLGRKSG